MIVGVSAAVSKTLVAPIERVQLLLQVQDANKNIAVENRYSSIGDCLSRIVAEQGAVALWRGNLANIVRYFLTLVALNFACKDFHKKVFYPYDPKTKPDMFFLGNMAFGGSAGTTSSPSSIHSISLEPESPLMLVPERIESRSSNRKEVKPSSRDASPTSSEVPVVL
jgi:hypothetical protein